jgi:hypothetical protein
VLAPSTGVLTNAEVVQATVFNYGTTALSAIPIQYTINAGTPVSEIIPGPIAAGTGMVYTFTQTADLSTPGNYTIDVCTAVAGDAVAANDCSSKTVTCFSLTDCDWYVIGNDSYGDGWNGGQIDIYSNSVLINSWAGPATTGPETYYFGIYEGETLDFVWINGSWDSEVTYTVYNAFGVAQFSQGPNPVTVTGIAGTCVPPACPDPGGLLTTLITTTSARFNWTEGGTETMWNIEWGLDGFVQGTGNLTTGYTDSDPFNPGVYFNVGGIPGLSPGTAYDWYVQADCGTDAVSNWVGPISFTTSCAPYTAPWTETFTTWPPTCWDMTGGTFSWVQYGGYCAEAGFWGQTSGNTDIMTTNTINIAGLTNPGLWFNWSHLYSTSYPGDTLKVFVTDDNGVTWTQVWIKGGVDLNSNDGATSTTPGSFTQSGFLDLSAFGPNIKVQIYGY